MRNAGVRAVKQRLCRSLNEVKDFLKTLPGGDGSSKIPLKCVVKPVQSAGSDDVYLCNNRDEALDAFTKISGMLA